ncbi:MAG: family 43 glycosylhydrolase [Bacteroidaceae bacterium]|nr:family 43 glycosylhydrolase [Bacteroidaceae bacterium]
MKKKTALLVMTFCMVLGAWAQNLTLKDIYIRDPFILPMEEEGVYYMYATSSTTEDGVAYGGMVAYQSKDLKTWTGPVRVFDVPRDNFLTGVVWAPEVHPYNGKYYLFATLNSDIVWKAPKDGHPSYVHRATQIFWADRPEGPFLPFENKLPHTPMGQMCLDGTLWVENGVPYMIYCHEWVEMMDGTMELVELKPDLSAPAGQPVRLFCASAAEWSTGSARADGERTYVTDGCFLYRTKTGKLLMIWSSFKNGNYAIGIAESATGRVLGPWRQQKEPLFEKNGGHGMIFRTFEGQIRLVLHSPNGGGLERAHLFEIEDCGDTLKLKGEVK